MLSYGEERDANIARNKLLIAELGIEKLKPAVEPKEKRHKKQKRPKPSTGAAGTNKRKGYADSDTDADEKPHTKTARVANDENTVPLPEEGRRRSSRIAGKPADATARVEQSRGTPQPLSVKTIVEDMSGQAKRERRYNP